MTKNSDYNYTSSIGASISKDEYNVIHLNKLAPGDGAKFSFNLDNTKTNINIKSRLYVSLQGELAGALEVEAKLGDARQFALKGEGTSYTTWENVNAFENPTSYTVTVNFPDGDNGEVLFGNDNNDNQYQDKEAVLVLGYEAVQGNAYTDDTLEAINTTLGTSRLEGANDTMHDALLDLDASQVAAVKERGYVYSVERDQFYSFNEAPVDAYRYFKIYESMPTTQDYSIYATGEGWTDIDNLTVGLDVGDVTTISNITYDRHEATDVHSVVIRTNSYSTVLTINAENDTVTHYGKANKVDITAVDNNNCYNEHGDIAGNINLEKGKVVVHNDCSAGAVVIDMTAAELATVKTLSADNSANKEVPIILNTSEVLWGANPNNGLISPTTNNIIYSSTGGTLPEDFNTMTNEQKEAAIASASDDLIQGAVAINNTGYSTLQAAINAAQDGDVIVLLDDIALGSSEKVTVNKTITLNMNEKTITGSAKYLVQVGSSTSIGHLTIRGNGSISSSSEYMLTVCPTSTLDIYDGNYVGLKSTFEVLGGIVTTFGGSFSTTATGSNYLAYLGNACSCNFLGGTFTTPTDGNYGIYITDASEVNLGVKGEAGPSFSTWRPCISSNGSESHACTINVYSGTFRANRNNTTIDDQNVIQLANATSETQKLNIYGGYFEQTSHLENSCIFTLKYSGRIELNLNGGTFNYGNNSKLFCGYGKNGSGYPSASNIIVDVENDVIPKNVTIEVYGSGVVRMPERDFVVNQ
ncbi:MAG: hypothetical protein E7175_01375 [Erysipelotrichaceae bacterium]|nr:hypothetical protein [Erysipelotrichaceae bacterium]